MQKNNKTGDEFTTNMLRQLTEIATSIAIVYLDLLCR